MNDMFGGGSGGPIDKPGDNVGPAPDTASTRFSNEAFERTPTTKQDDSSSQKAGDNAVSKPAESRVEASTENLTANEAAINGTVEGMQQTVDRVASGMSTQQGADQVRAFASFFAQESLKNATASGDKYGIQSAQMMLKQFGQPKSQV